VETANRDPAPGHIVPLPYTVSKRNAKGEPLAIRCAAHADCPWEAALSGPKRDDDPIFVALFERHMRDSVPNRTVGGHERRRRM
jgi:hypothetical protein